VSDVTMTLDLEKAIKRLSEKGLKLSIVRNGKVVLEANSHGISSLLNAIEKHASILEGASLADSVAGRAVALLCIYAKVRAVYAALLSESAKSVFEQNGIHHRWGNLVQNILRPDNMSRCPYEKLVSGISDPEEAFRSLKTLHSFLSKQGTKTDE
jgi:hypothetical protein